MSEDHPDSSQVTNEGELSYRDVLEAPDTHPALHPILHRLAHQDSDSPTTVNPQNLVQNREISHEALFQGELPYEPQPDEQDIGLSGLWRAHTRKSGSRGETVDSHFDVIPKIVEKILSDHERLSRSPEGANGAAIFSFLNPEAQTLVSDITTGCIKNWELALYRNEQPFLLSVRNEHLDNVTSERLAHLVGMQSLVIETAAAVMQVLPEFVENPTKPSKDQQNNIAKIVSNWGPNFAREWFNGVIIEKHFRESGLNEAEVREWLDTFTPSMRRYFAVHNITDPMAALDRVKENLDMMTDAAIAERLGWSEEDVRDIITPSIRRYFAVSKITDPMAALDRVKENLDMMTDAAIAEGLGWSEDDVRDIITPGMRRRFAVFNISDPMAGLIDYIDGKIQYSGTYYSGKERIFPSE